MGKKFRQSSTESKKEVFAIKIRIFKSKTGRSFWGDLINFLFLALLGIIMLIPVIFSVSNAFKPLDELFVFPPRFFVRNPTLDNFTILPSLFSDSLVPLSRYILNTVFITVVGTAGSIIIASMAAYVLEKKKFKARDMIFNIIVNTLLFTPTVTAIPNFLIMSKLGFINIYAAILIPVIGSSLNVFLMKQFMVGTFTDLILRVMLAIVLASTALGSVGIWCAWPIGWTISMVISVWFYRPWQRSIKRDVEE